MVRRCLLQRIFGLICYVHAFVGMLPLNLLDADAAEVECDFEHGVCEFSSSCKGGDCFVPVRAKLVDEGPAVDHTTRAGDGWYSRAQFSKNSWYESVAQLELTATAPFCFSAWVHVSGLKLPRVEMASRQVGAGWFGDEADKERVFYRAQSSYPELWRKVLYNEDRRGSMQTLWTDRVRSTDLCAATRTQSAAAVTNGSESHRAAPRAGTKL